MLMYDKQTNRHRGEIRRPHFHSISNLISIDTWDSYVSQSQYGSLTFRIRICHL